MRRTLTFPATELGMDVPITSTRPLGGAADPTLQALTGSFSVPEDATVGTVVGTPTGYTSGSTKSLSNNAGGRFAINSSTGQITVAGALDFETATSHQITVVETLAGATGSPRSTTLTVGVTDVDDTAPTITSGNTFNVAENSAFSQQLTANETVTWAKVGGADQALFTLTSGGLLTMTAKDFEAPADADANNSYVVQVVATDAAGNQSAAQTITVSVTNVADTAPQFTSNPNLTGTAQEGQTITAAAPTVTGDPTPTITYQWVRGTTPISGATGQSYTAVAADIGAQLARDAIASNGVGSPVTQRSNYTGQIVAAGGLSSTNATRTTANGVPPEVDLTMGADIEDGFLLRVQRTITAGPDWGTLQLDIAHYVTPSERAAGAIPNAALAESGYTNPGGGTYWQRYRWEREDGVVGPWSVITDTIVVSTAVWHTTTGVNKSQYLTSVGALQAYVNANVSAQCGVRSTSAKTGKGHFEITIDSFRSQIFFGVTDAATELGPSKYPLPGQDWPGCSIRTAPGTGFTLRANGAGSEVFGTTPPVAGDKLICEFDTDANTVSFWHWRQATGTSYQLGSAVTLTSQIPAAWHGYAAGALGNTDGSNADKFTANFGASPWARTPTSGYSGW